MENLSSVVLAHRNLSWLFSTPVYEDCERLTVRGDQVADICEPRNLGTALVRSRQGREGRYPGRKANFSFAVDESFNQTRDIREKFTSSRLFLHVGFPCSHLKLVATYSVLVIYRRAVWRISC
jgi:hypothetical protein